MSPFNLEWRERGPAIFEVEHNATVPRMVAISLYGRQFQVYANANLSIYSGQRCNARCPFCVEELRPAARGVRLNDQRQVLGDPELYLSRLSEVLQTLKPLQPSVSVTGGEPSLDPLLVDVLMLLDRHHARRRTMTTNGSGLFRRERGAPLHEWISLFGIRHLNISIAHFDSIRNQRIMGFPASPTAEELKWLRRGFGSGGPRIRLSCALQKGGVESFPEMIRYLEWAESLGIDNVVFRQLMNTINPKGATSAVELFSESARVSLRPFLDRISEDPRFEFQKQVMGYYYYVEVFRFRSIDVVFEEADLGLLEAQKRRHPGNIYEFVFHPNGVLCSTWQPWDGVIDAGETPAVIPRNSDPIAHLGIPGA